MKADVSKGPEVEALVQRRWRNSAVWISRSIMQGSKEFGFRSPNNPKKIGDRTIDINLKGVWLCLKYEIRQMLKQGGGGAIVNMASAAGLMVWRGPLL